ncbi:hypothetical protein A8F94_22320 [Bacillus sp. FJAT-27225]|uniref:hypothetical protein n=1 Tax=Bacillus sp. FJAT-27225 TaxID=1743144 RepID=UPI00080C2DD2|nr:hypothetical protein [Bacillus sp. FJAT-27225]OCA81605.1 hypothetical protein A8F94_22320 [Bacillus sp. FJAT-27225]
MRENRRSSSHYDNQIFEIDEQICQLLKQRKEQSSDNPGFPPDEIISNWAVKYGLYEDFLRNLFEAMRYEEFFKPRIEPAGFRKHLSVLKSAAIHDKIYSITAISQYENASIVKLHIDWYEPEEKSQLRMKNQHKTYELSISEQYDCRQERASGSAGHYTYTFIVAPPLPDDVSGITLVFREYSDVIRDKATGLDIIMALD